MKEFDPNEIAYRGQSITSLTREELDDALVELAFLINSCVKMDGRCKEALEVNEDSWDSYLEFARWSNF